ncbi:hypothetical protein DIPPA_19801 [Diplonema papillatum]|nr:hypothetical protein DIPPA_31941 [Diplonema papillatum]KAJ9441954.1 hypothetical protein DIPPA_19801 [Diplonema papillatum]
MCGGTPRSTPIRPKQCGCFGQAEPRGGSGCGSVTRTRSTSSPARDVEGLASAVPHDAVQEELYAALSPGGNPSLLPPDPMHASHLNTEESIRTLVHFALDALLKAQLNRAVLRGSATNGDRKRKPT